MQNAALCTRPAYWGNRYITKTLMAMTLDEVLSHNTIKKLLVVMKLTVFFLVIGILQVSAKGISQTVTFSGTNVPLKTILTAVKKQTGYNFFTSEELLEKATPVSIDAEDQELTRFLDQVLKGQFKYTIRSNNIILKPAGNLIYQLSPSLETPPITVRGRIINEKGEPVIASVIVKGTNTGTTSNANGEFEILNIIPGATLIISATNIETIVVNVNNQTNLSITAKTALASLDEIVINKGYYSTVKKLNTGNVAVVGSKEISQQPVSNPLAALQGRVAGVYIQQQNGLPGGGFDVQIRGRNSLRQTGLPGLVANAPLYLVDGVPFPGTTIGVNEVGASSIQQDNVNPLSVINPNDIESIEILKDADATAIYGSRGANGVVLITTKRGKAGETRVDLNQSFGFGKLGHKLNLLNTQEYIRMRKEAFANDSRVISATAYDINGAWDSTRYTDWQKELLGGTNTNSNSQLSVSGGNNQTSFLITGSLWREKPIYNGDFDYYRISTRYNLNHSSNNKKFRLNFSGGYSADHNTLPQTDLASAAVTLAPNAPALYDSLGEINWEKNSFNNPLGTLLFTRYKSKSKTLISNLNASYEVLKNLTIRINMGYSNTDIKQVTTNSLQSRIPSTRPNFTAESNFGQNNLASWIIEPQSDYKIKLGPGILNALVGMTFQQSKLNGESFTARGFANESLMENPSAASSMLGFATTDESYSYNALFGRINYTLMDKYIINLTGRRDGSSRFGPGRQFGNFGAVGMAWLFTNERLFDNQSVFSFGKMRASYGITGSDAIGNYGFLDSYISSGYQYQNTADLVPARMPNENFSWESTKQLELGLELGFIKNRINLSASYYQKRSSDQLLFLNLPGFTGGQGVIGNSPATVQNKGIEIEFQSINISNKSANWKWTTSFNLTIPKNELLKYPDLENSSDATNYKIGQSIFIRPGVALTGVDAATGAYILRDIDGDGVASAPADYSVFPEITQKYYGGLQNSLTYKGVEFSFLFQFVKQQGQSYLNSFQMQPGALSNQPAFVMERWQKTGDVTSVQSFTSRASSVAGLAYYDLWNISDARYTDASFIRLKNVSISYNFSLPFISRLRIKSLKAYILGQNLWTKTDYFGLDPETQTSLRVPPLRMISLGVQCSF